MDFSMLRHLCVSHTSIFLKKCTMRFENVTDYDATIVFRVDHDGYSEEWCFRISDAGMLGNREMVNISADNLDVVVENHHQAVIAIVCSHHMRNTREPFSF